MSAIWFDSHFHLKPSEDDIPAVLSAARAAGVQYFLVLGTSLEDCPETLGLTAPEEGVFVAIGMHPHAAETFTDMAPFEEWLHHDGVVAVGEIGLDYFYDFAPRPAQCKVFERFLELSVSHALPAVIHCRSAFQDCYDIVKATLPAGAPFLIHSFADGPAEAEKWLELGAMMSVNGMVTFNKAANIRESLAVIPLERLLVETDSPYLAPVPLRGSRNTPANIPIIGARVALEKQHTPEEIAAITTQNAKDFFRITTI